MRFVLFFLVELPFGILRVFLLWAENLMFNHCRVAEILGCDTYTAERVIVTFWSDCGKGYHGEAGTLEILNLRLWWYLRSRKQSTRKKMRRLFFRDALRLIQSTNNPETLLSLVKMARQWGGWGNHGAIELERCIGRKLRTLLPSVRSFSLLKRLYHLDPYAGEVCLRKEIYFCAIELAGDCFDELWLKYKFLDELGKTSISPKEAFGVDVVVDSLRRSLR